jgi:hypothetical protein
MPLVNEWGPVLLVCFTVATGIIFQNTRLSDFRTHFDKRIDDLRDLVKSEIARVERRIESLESPLAKR